MSILIISSNIFTVLTDSLGHYLHIYASNTTEELLGRKSSGSGLENREYGRRDPSR
jgi:hypothetical protein